MFYTAQSILDQFDHCADGGQFPVLDNGYVYPADVRLSVYRDDSDWLMIIESLGAYSPRTSGCNSFQNCLYVYGGDEFLTPGTSNRNFLFPVESLDTDPLFADEYDWNVRQDARSLEVRGQVIRFDPSPESLAQKGITLINSPEIDPPSVLRSLLPDHRELLLASDKELAQRNPGRLPLWLRLEEWNHPDISAGVMPGEHPTFQMLARAIATGDRGHYRPELLPNTAWWCWPEGGTL
jgi:hypothetical protein